MKEAFRLLGFLDQLSSFDDYFRAYSVINEQLWADYRNKKVSKEVLRKRRFAESLSLFNVKLPVEPVEVDNKYLEVMPSKISLFPGTTEVLRELKQRQYHLHIITNGFREVQYNKLVNCGIIGFISDIYISEEIKTTKPSVEIFQYAIKSSNARKTESLMIGDSWETDIVGAKNFGIDQVYFTPYPNRYEYSEQDAPTFHIQKITELLTILP
jgi:putative hydrolase of the HAD superfamily